MNIPYNLIYSQDNISGEIRIDIAHRIGKKNQSTTSRRPVVVKFVTRKGRDMVLKHAKNLKGKRQYVSEQLPGQMRERRMAQNDVMKQLRKDYPDSKSNRIHFVKDVLIHNGKSIDAHFEYNVLPQLDVTPFKYESVHHSEPIQVNGSTFQGHAKQVSSVEDAVKTRNALFQDEVVAASHHIMYAYRIDTDDGIFVTGNSDDGECMGSDILVKLLDKLKMDNVFLAVSRIHQGPNLGRKRFELIHQVGEEALQLV